MEQLTKQQIILLALLVSFVSSIASGITTVSLMRQDTQVPVTETINRVVERTVERVAADQAGAPAVTTKETIIVKQDDAIVSAIAKASKGVVRIYWANPGVSETFVGLGVLASDSGKIVAQIGSRSGGWYTALLDGGNSVPISFLSYDYKSGLSLFQADQSADPASKRAYSAVDFGDSSKAQIGQTAILISGAKDAVVATGIVSSIDSSIPALRTTIKDADFAQQAVLADLSGEIIGIRSPAGFDGGFIPSNIMRTYATP